MKKGARAKLYLIRTRYSLLQDANKPIESKSNDSNFPMQILTTHPKWWEGERTNWVLILFLFSWWPEEITKERLEFCSDLGGRIWILSIISWSSSPKGFWGNSILKICNKFTGEHPCRSVISIKFLLQIPKPSSQWKREIAFILNHKRLKIRIITYSCQLYMYFVSTMSLILEFG